MKFILAGEVEYITDMSSFGQLHAAFVTAKASANSVITKIDPTFALVSSTMS